MEKTISEAINDFQNYCSIIKSKATVEYQRMHFLSLLNYFQSEGIYYLSQIDKRAWDRMILHYKSTGKNVSVNKQMLLMKMLFRYSEVPNDYVLDFPKLRTEQNRYNAFSEDQLIQILDYISLYNDSDLHHLTRKLIVLLLLDTGCRGSELLNIEIGNIDFSSQIITLTATKTKITRCVFFSKMTYDLLWKYAHSLPNRQFLFYNYIRDRVFTDTDMRSFFTLMKKDLGIKKLTSRNFRHTTATVLVENGCPLETVQAILGHKSLMTTQIYLHLSTKKHHQDFQRFGVLSNSSEQKKTA